MDKKAFKLLYAIAIAILFILVGFYLIQKEDTIAVFVGYTNIFFWSVLILLSFYKLAIKK